MSCIKLPLIFQKNMVLQRNKEITINGVSERGNSISINFENLVLHSSILNTHFSITLPPLKPGIYKSIEFYIDKEEKPSLTLTDIMVGDVWLASGQSNMEFFLRYDSNWCITKKIPANPNIRMFNVPRVAFEEQTYDKSKDGFWFNEHDDTWADFSAPAYYFARYLQPTLDIPIGIIGCNWGGTPACAWMHESYLQSPLDIFLTEYKDALKHESIESMREKYLIFSKQISTYESKLENHLLMYGLTPKEQELFKLRHKDDLELPMGPFHHYRPSGLYHTMIAPISNFPIFGILWYQGESDSGHASIYDITMKHLIQCFRDTWKNESLPFLFVQLAPFGKWLDCTNDNYEILRHKQYLTSKSIANTGMISIMDLGSFEDIHPKEKREIGRRLALLARGKVYKQEISYQYAELLSAFFSKNCISLTFQHVFGKFNISTEPTKNFIVQHNSTILSIKNIEFHNNIITIFLDESCSFSDFTILSTVENMNIHSSSYISYAHQPYCEGNIWNSLHLPLLPFILSF